MRFRDLVESYDRLEATTKRLEMRAILSELIRKARPSELAEVLYLSQGLLRPEYEGIELGMADSLARKAVAIATGREDRALAESLKHTGDLGTTAALLWPKGRLDAAEPLTVNGVYEGLLGIANASGEGSQEAKIRLLVELLSRAVAAEAKYLIRAVLGRLRLGVREMTILDALTDAFSERSKEGRETIEAAFNVSSDLGLVAEALAEGGVAGLGRIRLTVGRPVRSMLAEREPTLAAVLERMEGKAAMEYKYDGLRIQAHVPARGPVRLFSRRLEEVGAQFPELVGEIGRTVKRTPVILEGECVPFNPGTDEILPFQEISRRRGRKHGLERMQTEVPVCLFVFDLLLDRDESLLDTDFPERRRRLESLIRPTERVRLAKQLVVSEESEAARFFDEAIAAGCEGVMAKSIAAGSAYHPGGRGFWWIKYKREYTAGLADSIDGVVVGAFFGRGRRAGKYGALLMAVYNPENDRYETFCKVGSGFDDALLAALPDRLKPYEIPGRPEDVLTELTPDQWIRPGMVLELKGAELTLSPIHRAAVGKLKPDAGLALRFPRFTGRFREDKGPTDTTTPTELLELYRAQVRQSRPASGDPDASSNVGDPAHARSG